MRIFNDILTNKSVSASENTETIDLSHIYGYTVQIVTSAGASTPDFDFQLQGSNDGSNWTSIGTATNVTTNTSFFIEEADVFYKYMRIATTVTTGSFTVLMTINAKGN